MPTTKNSVTLPLSTPKRTFVNEREEQLVFILSPEPKWGNYVVYPARVTDEGEYYCYLGRYGEAEGKNLPEEERKLLSQCRLLEPGELYARFGKKYKTEQLFQTKMDDKTLKSVRTYMDKTVGELLDAVFRLGLPLFLREDRWDNPYKKNQLTRSDKVVRPLLSFKRGEQDVRYSLRLLVDEETIRPYGSGMRILTEQPGLVLWNNCVYTLDEGFSGTRVKPFLQKSEIVISRENEAAYFRTFILKNIGHAEIEVEGFDIVDVPVSKQMVLQLTSDLQDRPVLDVRFKYNGRTLQLNSKKSYLVELKEEEGQYRFYKLSRDYAWEREMLNYLEMMGVNRTDSAFTVEGCDTWDKMLDWVRDQQESLDYLRIAVSQERLTHPYYIGGYRITHSREAAAADWFQLKAEIVLDNGVKFQLKDLWNNILSGKREFVLPDGSIFLIPEEWFARYSGLLLFARQGKSGSIMLKAGQAALLDRMMSTGEGGQDEPLPLEEVDLLPPAALKATLRDYQLHGFRWLCRCYHQGAGACLADDMGLGKTVQTISLLLKYKEESCRRTGLAHADVAEETSRPDYHTCLIVAPASVEHNWRSELQRFAPSLTVLSYIGVHRMRKREALQTWDVVTTTYQTMRNDVDFFASQQFGVVVFDEAQSFKNRGSQLYQAVKQLKADHLVALTGTPIENSLSDLWSLMDVINPGLLGGFASFQKHFIRPVENTFSEKHLESLNRLVQPFVLRRTKGEVLKDLPERTDEIVYCEQTPEQKKVYDEELSKARNSLLEQASDPFASHRAFNALRAIGRLRQLANEPRLLDEAETAQSGKFQEVFRMLESLRDTGHKVLLFSDYVKYLDLVGAEMDNRSWRYARLVGATKDREQQIAAFADNPDCQFFLISLKAGGVGINLTEADYVFILDPWWNTAAEEQAIGRAHRIGQKQAVFVYRFVTVGTLEERILEIQRKKSRLSQAVITEGADKLPLTTDELEGLIAGKDVEA